MKNVTTVTAPGAATTFSDTLSHLVADRVTAQAAGDGAVLAAQGRPVLRLHLLDQAAGADALRELLG